MSFSVRLKYTLAQPWSPDLITYMMSLHPHLPKHTHTSKRRKQKFQHTIQSLFHILHRGWFDMMHRLRKFDADKLTRSGKEWRPSHKWSTAQDQTCLPDLQRMSKELWNKNCSAQSSDDSKYYFMQFLHLIDLCSKKNGWRSQAEMINEWLMIHAFISQATWTSRVLIKLFVPLEMLSHGGVRNSSLFRTKMWAFETRWKNHLMPANQNHTAPVWGIFRH